MNPSRMPRALRGCLVAAVLAAGCHSTSHRATFTTPQEVKAVDREAPFLKCHFNDGRVIVLRKWSVDDAGERVVGEGILYDVERHGSELAHHEIPVADVALFETNSPEAVTRTHLAALVTASGISGGMTLFCAANPKACFGSCPTFYASDGRTLALQAEGFSASVARSLEATDVDALWTAAPQGKTFDLLMANEALETHVVDDVSLIAVPRPAGTRIFRAGETFRPASRTIAPTRCTSDHGDCTSLVARDDRDELFSRAGRATLAERETIMLRFPPSRGPRGLVVFARNTLLNTFIFYQGLAYMGRHAGEWMATIERDGGGAAFAALGKLLGDIDVYVRQSNGKRRRVGSFTELGPLAREVQLVPLPDDLTDGEVDVELSLTKGNWRIDRVALAEIGPAIAAVTVPVAAVLGHDGKTDPTALQRLREPGEHLITQPGDRYTLRFELPDGDNELFVSSRGYYYEWMRSEWMAEESATEVLRLMSDPAESLRRLAPKYRAIEDDMERVFWNSRFGEKP